MLMKSKIAKNLLVGFMGAGLVAAVGACTAPDTNTASESPATTESPMADTAESPMADTAESPTAGDTQTATSGATSGGTVDEVVAQDNSFSKLNAAIQAAGLKETLSEAGPYTIFAPTDEAFAALPAETVDKLLLPENKDKLQQVLSYHVVPGSITSASITPGDVQTVEGAPVSVSTEAGTVKVGDAQVIEPDITASNGVVHAIDKVLLPPDFQI